MQDISKSAQNTSQGSATGTVAEATISTLPNGLTIIVREDHSAPVVSVQAWCMAGSIHEGARLGAGMSHVLEHMLFKGTSSRPGSRIDQEVQEAGGSMNAYTSFDRTVFHIDVPSTGTEVALDVLCDVMQHATLPEDELAKEKQVILREMDMHTDDPGSRSGRRLFESAFTRSPYRFTVIGYPDLFHEITRQDLQQFYREKYAPNNVFYVVVGDVDAKQVVRKIEGCYEGCKARSMAPMVLPTEPRQTAPRDVNEEAPVELGYIHMAWHVPDVRHPDTAILDVAAVLLGSGRSSRLYRELREKQGVVHSADAWTYNSASEGLFGASATFDGERFEACREALLAEVQKLSTEPVTEQELSKAIRQFTAAFLGTRKTMQGQAQDLGSSWILCNDLSFSSRYLAAIKAVTPAEILRVARGYLRPENRTTYALLPGGSLKARAERLHVEQNSGVRLLKFDNGLRVLLKKANRLPFVEFRCAMLGGVSREESANNGVSHLMAGMLLKGTKNRTAEQLSTEIESVGGAIESYSANASFGLSIEVLKDDLRLGLDALRDVLRNATFPEEALARERQVQLANIRAQKDHVLHEAFAAMRRAMYGDSGYGLDPIGTEESVVKIGRDHLKNFYERQVTPTNCVLAVYGDVEPALLESMLVEALGDWEGGEPLGAVQSKPFSGGPARITETREKQQAVVVVGYRGIDVFNRDRYALELIQESCNDLGSRLFLRVREALGLAYYVGAQNLMGVTPGYLALYAGTSAEHAQRVEEELIAETEALRAEALTVDELRRAKAKVLGHRKIARQDLGAQALTHAFDELCGLGYDHSDHEDALYESVTREQVIEVARRYLRPEFSVISTILPCVAERPTQSET